MQIRIILTFFLLFSGFLTHAQTITFYTNRADLVESGQFSRWTKEFKKKSKVTVNVQALERYNSEMLARISRGDFGDVLLVPTELPALAWASYFLPLDTVFAKNKAYFSEYWARNNKAYALPLGVNVEGLIYNKDVFSKLNLEAPKTLSELYSQAQTIKQSGRTALALNIGAAWPLQQWDKAAVLIANDANYFREVALDDQPFASGKPYGKALEIARTLYNKGYSEKNITRDNWQRTKSDFSQGKVAMLFSGSWVIPQLLDAGVKLNSIGFTPFPVDESSNLAAVLNVDWGLAINKKSRNKKAAQAWVKYLLLESNYADVSGYLPSIKKRKSGLPQLDGFMQAGVQLIQMQRHDKEFLRLANKAGLDFYQGNSIRNILINSDFHFTLDYWNQKWSLAREEVPDA